jgi:hypothetical protein
VAQYCLWLVAACCLRLFSFGVLVTIDCASDRLRRSRKGANPASCRYENWGRSLSPGYATKGDNSDLALTAIGVDYVESKCSKTPIFRRLLGSGTGAATGSEDAAGRRDVISPEVLLPSPKEDSA